MMYIIIILLNTYNCCISADKKYFIRFTSDDYILCVYMLIDNGNKQTKKVAYLQLDGKIGDLQANEKYISGIFDEKLVTFDIVNAD